MLYLFCVVYYEGSSWEGGKLGMCSSNSNLSVAYIWRESMIAATFQSIVDDIIIIVS